MGKGWTDADVARLELKNSSQTNAKPQNMETPAPPPERSTEGKKTRIQHDYTPAGLRPAYQIAKYDGFTGDRYALHDIPKDLRPTIQAFFQELGIKEQV